LAAVLRAGEEDADADDADDEAARSLVNTSSLLSLARMKRNSSFRARWVR